jgi:ABC-2 type transport system ATP-binding protein
MEPAIEARALSKTYPDGVEAVAGIDFAVAAGEVFGLLGPNGAGKSTTVGILTGTVAPTSGAARVGGHDVERAPLAARRISSVVFQEPVVDRSLTGRRNLELHGRLWGIERASADARIEELTETFQLDGLIDRAVGTYSGGERRRLELARALVSRPRVLFLDEPTVGLDPRIRAELLGAIAGLRERTDLTVLLTTHYLEEAERLCDRVGIIHAGRLVALDSPGALLDELGSELVELVVVKDVQAAFAALRLRGVAGADAFAVGTRLTVPLHDLGPGDAVAAIQELGLASSVAVRRPTLNDVYLRLTGDSLAEAA